MSPTASQSGAVEFVALLRRLNEVERQGQEAVTCKLIDLIRDIFDADE